MSDSKVVSFDDGELFGIMGELAASDEAGWMQVHDLLLDLWLEIYEKHRTFGPKPGERAIFPVPVTASGIICMHDCPCMANAEFMWGQPGHHDGSRHEQWTLVVSCEQCMRDSGWRPAPEVTKYDA